MADLRKFGNTSNLVRFVLVNSSTGVGLTGLAFGSTGLIISTIADDEATATAYTVAGSTIETIATLGTFATPTASKCRFKEVDATNHPGLYEFQFADARFAVTSARRMVVTVSGATNLLTAHYEIQLVQYDPYDSVRLGLTAMPNAAAAASGGLLTAGTGTNQLSPSGGAMPVSGDFTGTMKTSIGTAVAASNVAGVTGVTFPSTVASPTNITAATGIVLSGVTHTGAVIPTVTNLTNAPTSGDLTATMKASVTAAVPTAAQNATAVWTDTTSSDFTTSTSPGKIIFTQLGGAFTTNSSSVFSTASLANAPTGSGSGLDAAGVRAAIGLASANLDTQLSTIAGYIDTEVGSLTTNLASANSNISTILGQTGTTGVRILGTQTLSAARDVSAVSDTSLTINDALHCAIAAAAGKEDVVSTTYTVRTPSTGTTIRVFTLDDATEPTSRT